MKLMKTVYQAVPTNKNAFLTYDGYVNHNENRSKEELKAEIEGSTGVEFEMCEILLVDSEPVKIEY